MKIMALKLTGAALLAVVTLFLTGCWTPPMHPTSLPANAAESAQWLMTKNSGNMTNLRSLPKGVLPEAGDIVAQVVSIDPSYRLVGLVCADGRSEQVKVALPFDLESMRKGEFVILRATEVPLRFKSQ